MKYKCRGCRKHFEVKYKLNILIGILIIYPILQELYGKGGWYCDKCYEKLK